MKRRAQRRFNKLYNEIADDWEKDNKLCKDKKTTRKKRST